LENKFSEGIKLIKRDIIFAASLYLWVVNNVFFFLLMSIQRWFIWHVINTCISDSIYIFHNALKRYGICCRKSHSEVLPTQVGGFFFLNITCWVNL
jgi:hypothetical protein